jgi:tripartite-type tricarboxylate transporter receptor subunit TctC
VIAANIDSEFTSLAKLIEAAKAKPGQVNYASPGNGATPHFAVELFARAAGIQLQHIPYKGGAAAITDVLGGQLPLVAVNALEALPHARAGKLRILASLSARRPAVLPDAPTIAESGFPGFEASVWYGVIAPAKTPPEIIAKLTETIRKVVATSDMTTRLSSVGGEVSYGTPAQFATLIHDERLRYQRVAREGNIKPD